MTEYVAEPHRECYSCRQEKKSLAQHWTKSSCSYPPLSDAMRETVEGLLVGDASVDGRAHARVELQSVRREHALFCHQQLGPLSHGVTRTERSDTDGPLYRLRTHAHPDLDRYWRWSNGIPEDVTLSRRGLRLWYACDGAIEFGGRATAPKITVRAVGRDRRATVARLLRGLPVSLDVRENAGRVTVVSEAVPRLLRYLGPPTPGSVHKWCLDESVYRTVRERSDPVVTAGMSAAERYKALLGVVADALGVGATLTAEDFRDAIGAPRAQVVADALGGGSFDDALHIAGVGRARTAVGGGTTPKAEDKTAVIAAIRAAADDCGEPLSTRQYDEWATENGAPSKNTVYGNPGYARFDSWTDACDAVGVEHGGSGGAPFHANE